MAEFTIGLDDHGDTTEVRVTTDNRGRITLPTEIREASGIGAKTEVVITIQGTTVTIQAAEQKQRETIRSLKGAFSDD